MAAYFIDLDGTVLKWGKNEFLPGALEMLRNIKKQGHQIFFTTYRGPHYPVGHFMHPTAIVSFLKSHKVEYDDIIYGVESPRVIINDDGCHAINHPSDSDVEYDPCECLKDRSKYGR